MYEKTHAQKIICSRIKQKNKVDEFQDYQEHIDYTAYNDYSDCHGDYYDIGYGDDIDYGWPENKPLPQEDCFAKSICKKIKAQIQSLYQRFMLTNHR